MQQFGHVLYLHPVHEVEIRFEVGFVRGAHDHQHALLADSGIEESVEIEHRRSRDYDCRIYAAAELVPDGNCAVIEQRVTEWRFSFASDADRANAAAMRRAAQFIRSHAALFPPAVRAGSATAAAVLALKTYPLFLTEQPGPPESTVIQLMERVREFDRA